MAVVKVYVGCALTGSPAKFKHSIEEYKELLRQEGYEVFDFLGVTAGTPQGVYEWDIGHCIKNCDAFIAICNLPGLGLGFEIGYATSLQKPILCLAHHDSQITRLIKGAAEAEPKFKFKLYKKLHEDGLRLSSRWLEGLKLTS